MKDQIEKQAIEEMVKDICHLTVSCEECTVLARKTGQSKEQYCKAMQYAKRAVGKGYRRQSEWISVEERLPDNGNAVLVNRYNKRLKFSVANIDNYQGYGKWWDKDYDGTVWTITHWMPLPEPPKMKGGAE